MIDIEQKIWEANRKMDVPAKVPAKKKKIGKKVAIAAGLAVAVVAGVAAKVIMSGNEDTENEIEQTVGTCDVTFEF